MLPGRYWEHPIVDPTASRYSFVMTSTSRSKSLGFLLISALLVAFIGAACNTTKGLGKDVEKLGDKIQDKAR